MIAGRKYLSCLLTVIVICATAVSCRASEPTVAIGMTVHSRGSDTVSITRQFDLMAAMNVGWVRVDVDWSAVEPQRGQFDWSYPDTIVDESVARGMNVLLVLAFTPSWARPSATGNPEAARHARPENLGDWAQFAQIVAERYAPRGVGAWEVWNEPNTSKFWPPRPDVNEYGTLFWVAADAIRGIDPDASILIGGLGPKFEQPDAEVPPQDYLEQLYANGAAQHADGIAAHPYSFPSPPMGDGQRMVGGFRDLPALHAVMDRHGDGGKKIWITEFGAPTGTGPNAVSEQDQAEALLQARDQLAQWDWAGPLIYYELADGGTDVSDPEQNFGVLHHDLVPKPAAEALMQSTAG